MFFKDFQAFIDANPYCLWSVQRMQHEMMRVNLGVEYWTKKIEQYRVMRKEIGVELLKS
jgi:hypothetical protein